MKRTINSSMILALTLAITSCGKNHSKDPNIEATSPITLKKDLPLNDLTKNLQLDSETPVGLGTLLNLKKGFFRTSVSLCTAFLVDKDLLLTNSHCIPDTLKDNPNLNCGHTLQMVMKTDSGFARTKCEKVIKYSSVSNVINNKEDDYALIKISDSITLSKYFTIDRSGFREDEKIVAQTLDHTLENGTIISQFTEHSCLIKSSDIYGRVNSPASSPITGFKEIKSTDKCKIISGNSGSPVINNNRSVVGIIHGGYNKKADKEKYNPAFKDVSTQLAAITNLRCISLGDQRLDHDIPTTCPDEKNVTTNNNLNFVDEKIKNFFELATQEHVGNIKYDINTHEIDQEHKQIQFIPKCVMPIESWSKNKVGKIKSRFGKKSFEFTTNTYLLTTSLKLNYYGVMALDLKSSVIAVNNFKISNLQKMDKNKSVELKYNQDETIIELAETLPLCQ